MKVPAKASIQQLLNGGMEAAALRNTSSDTWASSSTQGTCCKAASTCSTVAHPTSFQFTLLSWVGGFSGAGRGDYPAQPCMSLGRAVPGSVSAARGQKWGWQVAATKPHVTVTPVPAVAFPGLGGSGCPDVGRWGADMSRWDPLGARWHRDPAGTPVQLRAAQKLPNAPAPPPAPREVEKHKRERQEGWERWERGREGESPMPGANPSSSRRGISNNNRPWSRPDGFDLITEQGGLGSFRSLPKGRILGKQQRAIQAV